MRPFRRPSPAGLLAFIALCVALGGTALAATGQLVNITDPTTASNRAKVSSAGALKVGDGSGPMTVDGTTTSREAPPAALWQAQRYVTGSSSGTCETLYMPPAGSAAVIRTLNINPYAGSTDPSYDYEEFWIGSACGTGSKFASFVHRGYGSDQLPIGDGAAIPAGDQVSVTEYGDAAVSIELAGHTVAAGEVPGAAKASGTHSRTSGPPPPRRAARP